MEGTGRREEEDAPSGGVRPPHPPAVNQQRHVLVVPVPVGHAPREDLLLEGLDHGHQLLGLRRELGRPPVPELVLVHGLGLFPLQRGWGAHGLA